MVNLSGEKTRTLYFLLVLLYGLGAVQAFFTVDPDEFMQPHAPPRSVFIALWPVFVVIELVFRWNDRSGTG